MTLELTETVFFYDSTANPTNSSIYLQKNIFDFRMLVHCLFSEKNSHKINGFSWYENHWPHLGNYVEIVNLKYAFTFCHHIKCLRHGFHVCKNEEEERKKWKERQCRQNIIWSNCLMLLKIHLMLYVFNQFTGVSAQLFRIEFLSWMKSVPFYTIHCNESVYLLFLLFFCFKF